MSDTAFQTVYRNQFIDGFEDRTSRLRKCTVTEANVNGNAAVFLVADSGSATATTRGTNGLIPARADNNTQLTATISEWHDLVRKTGFNVFASQGNQMKIMQQTTMGVLNRKIDDDIIAQLDTATNDTGTAQAASVNLITKATVILGNNFVPVEEEENMFFVGTPALFGYLNQTPEFASADYVDVLSMTGSPFKAKRWMGFNWIMHPRLTGVGTSTEKCYAFHRNAIGHAVDKGTIQTPVGYNQEQDYSWARASAFMGSKLLQNSGVVQVLHDGSAYVAS
jgi:hypothetical protein